MIHGNHLHMVLELSYVLRKSYRFTNRNFHHTLGTCREIPNFAHQTIITDQHDLVHSGLLSGVD